MDDHGNWDSRVELAGHRAKHSGTVAGPACTVPLVCFQYDLVAACRATPQCLHFPYLVFRGYQPPQNQGQSSLFKVIQGESSSENIFGADRLRETGISCLSAIGAKWGACQSSSDLRARHHPVKVAVSTLYPHSCWLPGAPSSMLSMPSTFADAIASKADFNFRKPLKRTERNRKEQKVTRIFFSPQPPVSRPLAATSQAFHASRTCRAGLPRRIATETGVEAGAQRRRIPYPASQNRASVK